ncbi:MAG: ADOP family duplicated permease [Bryobacteraceae bacterium]
MRTLLARITAFFRKRELDRDLDRELAVHLDLAIEDNIRRGLSPEEARRDALVRFGGVEAAKEHHRDARGLPWLDSLLQDVRYALRTLRRDAAFTTVAVLILALGIGANTAVFSLGNVFLFRPLPVKDADRLAVVAVQREADSDSDQVSYLDYLDYRAHSSAVFTDMTGYCINIVGLGYRGRADRLIVSYVPSNFFSMLGIRPALGRLIDPGEGEAPGTAPVVVLGHSYWEKRFGGDPDVIGRTVRLNGTAVTVIGVVPKEFLGPYSLLEMDAYAPIGMQGFPSPTTLFTSRAEHDMRVLATLKPGVGIAQAQAALNVIGQRLAQVYPQADQGQRVRVFSEPKARPEPAAADSKFLVATVFLVMVGLVLVVACLNVANLLLARAAAREKEIAIRAAIGAGRKRLLRQLLTESMLLAMAGGVGGAIVGNWVSRLLNGLRPLGDLPLRLAFAFDWRVFAYVAGTALLAGVLAGLAPAMRVSRTDLNLALREGGRGLIGESGRPWLRNGLVIAQVAGSLILLVAAGLFTRSLTRAESIDLGFDPHNVLNVSLDPGLQGYTQARAEALCRELLRRTQTLPGVRSASLAFSIPLGYYNDSAPVYAAAQAPSPSRQVPGASLNAVSPDYFTTMRMRILEGRAFADADTAASEPVAIVNQTMAERLWPHRDAVGQRFSYKGDSGPLVTVVGVAHDAKTSSLLDAPGMYFYVPQAQHYRSTHVLQARTSVPPESLAPAVESLVRQLDPNLPVYEVMSMEKSLAGGNGFLLFEVGATFAGALGGLGLLLAVVGVYGVVSYSAGRRRHELGIRMALGAQRDAIFRLVIRQAVLLVGFGIALGLVAALGVSRLLASLLVGVSAYDPVTFVCVSTMLMASALLACYIPAHRAARVEPMAALRDQ